MLAYQWLKRRSHNPPKKETKIREKKKERNNKQSSKNTPNEEMAKSERKMWNSIFKKRCFYIAIT